MLNADDRSLFAAISTYWAQFAAAGDPNRDHDDLVDWPAFKRSHGKGRGGPKQIVLDVPVRIDDRLPDRRCDFWKPYFLGSVAGSVPASQQ